MDYRPPASRQPQQFNGSLDGLFEQYQAQKSQKEAAARQDFADTVQYGTPIRGLTPEQLQRGAMGPTVTPAVPQGAFPNNMVGLPTPAQPAQEQFDNDPHVAAIQRFIQNKRQTDKVSLESTQAGTLEKTAKAKLDLANAALADRKPFDVEHSEKANQFNIKRFTQLGDALDPSKARAGAFGTSKQVFDRAERLQTLASAYRDSNLDSRQVEELAIGLNSMLSGSNVGAASQVEKLVPKSIVGDAQKLKEWIMNDPKGTNQQEFVKRMLGSIEREKATASDQIKRTQFERIGRYGDLEKADADEFHNVLQSAGIDPEEYRSWKKGGFKRASAVQSAEGGDAARPIALTGAKAARLAELRAKAGR